MLYVEQMKISITVASVVRVLKQASKQVFRLTAVVSAHGSETCAQGGTLDGLSAHISSRDGHTRGLRWRTANYLQRRVNNRWQRDAANNRRHRCCLYATPTYAQLDVCPRIIL